MPLEPKQDYSTRIYAEILASVGASMIRYLGPKVGLGVFSPVSRPVGVRDAKRLIVPLGVSKGNAASAVVLISVATRILGVETTIDKLDPARSIINTRQCRFGDVVIHHEAPILCAMCVEYLSGIADALGVRFIPAEKLISTGCDSCIGIFEADNPSEVRLPTKAREELMVNVGRALYDQNSLAVSTLSAILIGLGQRAERILKEASLVHARNAFKGGALQGPVFLHVLGLSKEEFSNSASLVCAVREALGCRVSSDVSSNSFSIVTEKCPQADYCKAGGFLEVACASYTRGLIYPWGDFEVRSEIKGGVCRQEFALRRQKEA